MFVLFLVEKMKASRTRLANLGIEDIYLGAHNKIEQYQELVKKYDLKAENIFIWGMMFLITL